MLVSWNQASRRGGLLLPLPRPRRNTKGQVHRCVHFGRNKKPTVWRFRRSTWALRTSWLRYLRGTGCLNRKTWSLITLRRPRQARRRWPRGRRLHLQPWNQRNLPSRFAFKQAPLERDEVCHVEVSIQPSLASEDCELSKTLVQLPCSGLHRSKCLYVDNRFKFVYDLRHSSAWVWEWIEKCHRIRQEMSMPPEDCSDNLVDKRIELAKESLEAIVFDTVLEAHVNMDFYQLPMFSVLHCIDSMLLSSHIRR